MFVSIISPSALIKEEDDDMGVEIMDFEQGDHDTSPIDAETDTLLPTKKARRLPMSAQQQRERIDEIEQALKTFENTKHPPPRTTKKRKTITPEPSSPMETDVVNLATPPAEEAPEKPSNDTRTTSRTSKSTRKEKDSLLNNIPPKIVELMKTLDTFGSPFEKVLSRTVKAALTELRRMNDTETLVTELEAIEREWKLNNRASLQKVEALLSRNGVVAIGGVEIPSGSL
ncbi:uncharacterized protein RCC_08451 [Ramularia collo-cygni]|uniref:Uncharacterized protein n=1 Tax=Ramularia collo-cygni TaxID=112498 RepID=A0A2D3V056_9PEZI|nr:uncharacterized protein RCC_08451 [Ramularia collo-cygni]CZT22746.1 uncharacterized protein RCC_08451 [Ramularia collo-cygni]